jgi:hypothetical protein
MSFWDMSRTKKIEATRVKYIYEASKDVFFKETRSWPPVEFSKDPKYQYTPIKADEIPFNIIILFEKESDGSVIPKFASIFLDDYFETYPDESDANCSGYNSFVASQGDFY